MSGSTELLLLRLALIIVMLAFVWVVALSLRQSLAPAPAVRPARDSRSSGWRLVVQSPGDSVLPAGAEFGLAGRMTVGRDPGSGIMLAESSVSGRHAAIERVRDGWRLVDLGSTNGTSVNGRAVPPQGMVLRGGERLAFGVVVVRLVAPTGGEPEQ